MSQSLSNVLVHLVFSTKNREPTLTAAVRDELFPYIVGTLQNNDCECLQIGGVEDHVHILFRISRKMSIAEVVEKVKTSSSKDQDHGCHVLMAERLRNVLGQRGGRRGRY